MTDSPPLFVQYHRVDPPTSRFAANAMKRAGAARRNLDVVMLLVHMYPGWTAAELAMMALDLELQEVRRRLTDGKRLGLLVQGEARPCSVRGTRMVTWGVA